jgi:multiple sugar transport system ATP-binding protein
MSTVYIKAVQKYFDQTHVIRGVSIDIQDGEFCVLVGPSGCGKSTLLRMIAGLEEVSQGTISIGDKVVNDMPSKERDIAMVFQSYALYPHMNVRDNMAFSLEMAKMSKVQIRSKVDAAAGTLGLQDLLDRFPRQLSGGQRQRVAMGRCMVRDPSVFLFDEPLSNLDAKLRVAMRTEIRSLHQRLGTTSIYVTHDQIEAMTMADKIVVMRDGLVEQVGSPLTLYDCPANQFVAGFIGSPAMNFLSGRVSDGRLVLSDGQSLAQPPHTECQEGQSVTIGIRPEHVSLSSGDCKMTMTLKSIEPTGADTLVHTEIAGEPMTGMFRERVQLKAGQALDLFTEARALHVFDAGTGHSLRKVI